MKYNVRKWNPILIGIPDIGIGIMWASLGNVVAFFGYHFTHSAGDIAEIYMFAAVVGVITQIVIGILSDKTRHKWGKRSPWLVYGMVFGGISIALWPLATNFIAYFIMVGTTCILINIAQCSYYTMVMEVVDKDQIGKANTIARTTSTVGALIMGVLAGYIWNNNHPEITFAAMAIIMIISTLLIVPTVVKERPENYTKREKQKFSFEFLYNKEVLKLFFITFLFFAANTGISQMGTSLFVKTYHFTEHVVGRFAIFNTTAGLIFGISAFKYIDRFSKKNIFIFATLGLVACNIFLVTFLHTGASVWILYSWTFMYGIFFLAGNICMYSTLALVAPPNKLGWYMGLLNFAVALPQFLMSDIYGHILDSGNAEWIVPMIIVFYLIACITALTMKIKEPGIIKKNKSFLSLKK
ncbi:MAG: SLC45 family MFS transporter [bacterium]|nr:SLC45 family MFS transporter [bacterium]